MPKPRRTVYLMEEIMKKNKIFAILSVLVIVTMLLASCKKAPTADVTLSFRVVDRAYLPSPDKVAQEIRLN
jgi:uncharacterized lipoprotein YajG